MAGSEADTNELREGLERVEDLKKKHLDDERADQDASADTESDNPQPRD